MPFLTTRLRKERKKPGPTHSTISLETMVVNHLATPSLKQGMKPDVPPEKSPDLSEQLQPEKVVETEPEIAPEITPVTEREVLPEIAPEITPATEIEVPPEMPTEIETTETPLCLLELQADKPEEGEGECTELNEYYDGHDEGSESSEESLTGQ